MTKLPTQPGIIHLSDEERKTGKWSRANVQRAMEYLHRDGLLAMTGLCDLAHLDAIREFMLAEAPEIRKTKLNLTDFNHGIATNHLQSPPLTQKHLLFEDVYSNQFVHQIVRSYLGPDIVVPFLTGNTAIANTSARQNVHKDAPFMHPLCPYMLNCNILLSDFTPENGSTEFWLGSHATTDASEQLWRAQADPRPTCDVAHEHLAHRAEYRPGEQVKVPFGAFMLRDMRTWHAGMPNTSDVDRIMLAIAYQAGWYPNNEGNEHLRYKAPESAREILTKRTPCMAQWLPDEEWDRVSQVWGLDVPNEDRIFLPIGPGMDSSISPGPGEVEWLTLNVCADEDKIVHHNPNDAAPGGAAAKPVAK